MTQSTSHTALITGGSRGLGLALARGLAQLRWNLIIDARGAEALNAARDELARLTSVIAIAGDVTDAAHREALVEAVVKKGGLDALVNSASILGPSPQPPLLEYPLDVLERVYRTNVIAPLALIQALRYQLKPGVCVINITSDAGVEAYEGWGGYGSSKAALEQLVGVGSFSPAWWTGNPGIYTMEIRVDPSRWRQGIGTTLCDRLRSRLLTRQAHEPAGVRARSPPR